MASVLEINHLSKKFGAVQAVDDLSLRVEEGSIYGLLGPNGSGKTTTLGIAFGVVRPSGGSFRWFGRELCTETKRQVGALIETPNFYPYLSGRQNLQVAAEVKGADHREVARVLEVVGLEQRGNSNFKGYSLGMKQRLALASALLGDPRVLVLDEPTNGLDPQGIAEVRELILRIAGAGKTIILASHLLDEVEKVCTHVAVLRNGRLLAEGPVSAILSAEDQVLVYASNLTGALEHLRQFPEVLSVSPLKDHLQLTLQEGFSSADLNRALMERGVVLSQLIVRKKSLESQFMQMMNTPAL
ncbi:ABC transporter ATP-binding protein [soil metagenome]